MNEFGIDNWIDINPDSDVLDLSPVMEQCARVMYESVMQNFASGGRPTTWKPKYDGPASHLQKTGYLRSSISYASGPTWARVGFMGGGPIYRFIHQYGGLAGPTFGDGHPARIPPRPYMMFQRDDKEIIKRFIGEAVLRVVKAKIGQSLKAGKSSKVTIK